VIKLRARSTPRTSPSTCACCAADQVKDRPQPDVTESIDTNILDFCSIDSQGRRLLSPKSLGEKEQDYLDALRVRHLQNICKISDPARAEGIC